MPQSINGHLISSDGYNITAAETYTYFKATDGNTYQITYYKDNPTGTTITQYTGDATVSLVDYDYTGYAKGGKRY